MPKALTDAAVVYGAQRYFDRLHRSSDWRYKAKYKEDDDRTLFLEFIHNILLYDEIILDDSSIESDVSTELSTFIDIVNSSLGRQWIKVENVGSPANVNVDFAKHSFCRLLLHVLSTDPEAATRINSVPIPWAYMEDGHYERPEFVRKFEEFKISLEFLPFAIFVWRAMTYGAMAQHKLRVEKSHIAYVAAPGRLSALKAIMNSTDVSRYNFPRELLRDLEWALPQFPTGGFDFTNLSTVPFFEVSPVASTVARLAPAAALSQVCSIHDSPEVMGLRDDWNDILFNGSRYSAVGNLTNIQIMKNVSGSGPITQTLKAVPIWSERAYG